MKIKELKYVKRKNPPQPGTSETNIMTQSIAEIRQEFVSKFTSDVGVFLDSSDGLEDKLSKIQWLHSIIDIMKGQSLFSDITLNLATAEDLKNDQKCKMANVPVTTPIDPDPDVHSQEINKKPQDNKKDEPMTTQVIEKQEDAEIRKIKVQKDSTSVKNPDKSYKKVVKHVEENIDVVNEQEDNSSGLDTKDAHLKAKDIRDNQVDGISNNLIIDLGEDKSTVHKDVDSNKDRKKVTFDTLDNTATNTDEPNLCISSVQQTLDAVIDEALDDLEADSNRSDTVSDVGNSYDDLPLSQMQRRNLYIGNSSENTDQSDDISPGNTEEELPDEIW